MHRPLYKTESMPNPNQSQNKPTVTILSEWEYLCFYLSKLSKQIRCDKKIRFYSEHQNSCGVKWKHWMHKRHWTGSQCSNEACMCWRWISLFPCYRRLCLHVLWESYHVAVHLHGSRAMKCAPRAGWIFVGFGVPISLLFAIFVLALANSKRRVCGFSGSNRTPWRHKVGDTIIRVGCAWQCSRMCKSALSWCPHAGERFLDLTEEL